MNYKIEKENKKFIIYFNLFGFDEPLCDYKHKIIYFKTYNEANKFIKVLNCEDK